MTTGSAIVVRRPIGGWRDRIRKYTIEIDGAPVGQLARGQELRVDIPPGRHQVRARIDWTGSPALVVEVREGHTVSLTVQPAGSAWQTWRIAGAESYLKLTES